jgi:Putative transposase
VHCRPGFLLPARVLSCLFRRLFLSRLADAHAAGQLAFISELEGLCRREAFAAHLAPLRRKSWFVYAKAPFAGPEAVLAYLARYTHRVAIPNNRLLGLDERGVTFRYKDYHLIAPHACGGTLLPPLRRCRPGDPKGVCDTGDHAKITPSTAAATTNSRR